MCIKHRHIGKGLGISIFMLVQSYCAQGGINRAIRENCTLLLLFKLNQDAQIKKLYSETDLDMTEEQFIDMCKEVSLYRLQLPVDGRCTQRPQHEIQKWLGHLDSAQN